MFKKFYLSAIIFVLFSSVSAFSQTEDGLEGAASSNLTGISLPAKALRVLPGSVPAEVSETLEKLIASGEGKIRQGDSEVLVWTGSEVKKTGKMTIVNRLTNTLKSAGWEYELSGEDKGVSIFTAFKDGANKRAVIGFYGEEDGTLVFAWSEVLKNDGVKQINSNSQIEKSGVQVNSENGSVSDYSFVTPAGWSQTNSPNEIVLSNNESKISFLPLMNSSGNLEADADRILWQVFKGYNSWFANGFEADYGTFEKGRTSQGLEYFRAYRYAKKAGDSNDGFSESKFDAIILLVKIDNKVAVIVGSEPFQTDNHRDSALRAIDLILYDLTFKSITNSYNLKNDLLGSWSAASGSVALAYTFNANGTFNKGAAAQFRTSRDAYTDNVTTTSYGMTDTYSLSGNLLTENYKKTREIYKYKIRIYDTKYDKDAWQHKVGFLPTTSNDGDTIVLRKSN
ncbi:MAG TPA: hypothetical protein PKY82_00325 [Pyrinomonadaceae bacterium]|nr:hypothetical protein [Pyrinomonadaceae bacterium]